MKLNPVLADMTTYPFVELEREKERVAARLGPLVDFGVGDPYERTPEFIRKALIAALPEKASYPRAVGLPELRGAIAGWYGRRFGVEVDAETEVVPTAGSKEAIFSLVQIAVDRGSDKNLVVVTEPGYPVPERAARLHGARIESLPLVEGRDFLVDLDSIDAHTWRSVALFWINYPNNPTGAVATPAFFQRLADLALEHDFLVASDEAYSEIYFDEPPHSALEVESRTNVVAFNTLSKRSAMTGYRSGCVVADPDVIAMIKRYRPQAGTASPEFIQRAAIAAWSDEEHVDEMRSIYKTKRDLVVPALLDKGLRIAGSRATFYLWVAVPDGETSRSFATRLLEAGVVVAPGSFFGDAGEGYMRLALVPTIDECRRAVEVLGELL